MLTFHDTLRGAPISVHYLNRPSDWPKFTRWLERQRLLGMDTESTGLNPYRSDWELRTVQVGNKRRSFVIPAPGNGDWIGWLFRQPIKWLGHNGTHDFRCIDAYLGYETGGRCVGDTFIPSHHHDSRNAAEGGVAHGLKEQAIAYVDRDAGRWEVALKAEFKKIRVPIPGAAYKSGPRKGQPRTRAAHLAEGWGLIDPRNPAYIMYAGLDPILTYHLWHHYRHTVVQQHALFAFDMRVQQAADRLQRRAIRLDVDFTEKLSNAYLRKAKLCEALAAKYGCTNINSGPQLAATLDRLGIALTERTPTGQVKTSNEILRRVRSESADPAVREFIQAVLIAKQCHKRRESYTEAMLRERDATDRVHPSINILGAVTARMSVSNPALQQLPTKDRDDEEDW
jgi:DNA polymerase-1